MLINVLDYPTPAHAIAAAMDGDRVYFPNIRPYTAPPGGWLVRHNIEIFGDGPGRVGTADGTTFYPGGSTDNDHVFILSPEIGIELSHVYFHDFKITKRPSQSGKDGSAGFYCKTDVGQKKSASRYERVAVLNLRNTAYHFEGLNGGDEAIVNLTFMDCDAAFCGRGMYFKSVFTCAHVRSYCNANDEEGCRSELSGIAFYHSGFENNCQVGGNANLFFDTCHIATVSACHFERIHNGPKRGVRFDHCGGSGQVSGCNFVDPSDLGSTAIYVPSDNDSGPIVILSNRATNIPVIANVGAQAYNCVVMPQFSATTPVDIGSQMQLPSTRGTIGAPLISRGGSGPTGSSTSSGFAVPAIEGGPSQLAYVIDGMLFYDKDASELRLRRGGVWAPATQIVDANVPADADISGTKLRNASIKAVKLSTAAGDRITRLQLEDGCVPRQKMAVSAVGLVFGTGAAAIAANGMWAYRLDGQMLPTGVTFTGPQNIGPILWEFLLIECRSDQSQTQDPTAAAQQLIPKVYADRSGDDLFWLQLINPRGSSISPVGLEFVIEFLSRN